MDAKEQMVSEIEAALDRRESDVELFQRRIQATVEQYDKARGVKVSVIDYENLGCEGTI